MKKAILPFGLFIISLVLFVVNINSTIGYLHTMFLGLLISSGGVCLGITIDKIINKKS